MPRWQKLYAELKDQNFVIVSVAQDTGGVKDAGKWITDAKAEYPVLIDQTHLVTRLYNMVNVPTFMKEVLKLNGKPYYAPRCMPEVKKP